MVWFNADAVRQEIHKDLGFSEEDRIEHARRMGKLADWCLGGGYVISDFCCPTEQAREEPNPDYVIWVTEYKKVDMQIQKKFQDPTKDKLGRKRSSFNRRN